MSNISINNPTIKNNGIDVNGLKKLSVLNISLQYFLVKGLLEGSKIFNNFGENSLEHKNICENFISTIEDLLSEFASIQSIVQDKIKIIENDLKI